MGFLAGMEISEEQRKQAIVNARRAKQGKSKSKQMFCFMLFSNSSCQFPANSMLKLYFHL